MTALPWHTFTPSGECIAMLHDLPGGTRFLTHNVGMESTVGGRFGADPPRPVIVVAWPDGTTPTPPADDDGWIYTDDADEVLAAYAYGKRVEVDWRDDPTGWEASAGKHAHTADHLWLGTLRYRIAREDAEWLEDDE